MEQNQTIFGFASKFGNHRKVGCPLIPSNMSGLLRVGPSWPMSGEWRRRLGGWGLSGYRFRSLERAKQEWLCPLKAIQREIRSNGRNHENNPPKMGKPPGNPSKNGELTKKSSKVGETTQKSPTRHFQKPPGNSPKKMGGGWKPRETRKRT